MLTDSEGELCPFCPGNGKVRVVVESGDAYLIQVVKGDEMAIGRYFIIPKQHMESLLDRPKAWTEWENELLNAALVIAASDEELVRLMAGRPLSEAINLNWNQGIWAGQRVRHIHLWVVFRYDNLKLGIDGLIKMVEDQHKDLQAAAVLMLGNLRTEQPCLHDRRMA